MSRDSNLQGLSIGHFNQAHNFTIQNVSMTDNANHENHLMGSLAKCTIPGAEFDSSARDPPPSCYPGTRLDISNKLRSWMHNAAREKKLTWMYGPAGVGKSAIMQTLAELEHESTNSILGATFFFSRTNQRNDPRRIVITIAYQLAVMYKPYRCYILDLFDRNPKLIEKSLSEQFKNLIVKPFAEIKIFEGSLRPILTILDGLDECEGERAQREIILLIGKFVLQYPDAPLIWIIASRPEPHIRAAFNSRSVQSAYSEVEVPIDSTQACFDVEKYLRSEFDEIQEKYPDSFPPATQQWPTEAQFTKIARGSSGLFAFAAAVIRFIDDINFGNPVYKLQRVLVVIDSVRVEGQDNPFATLDALYMEIMSTIPLTLLPTAMKLLGYRLMPYKSSTDPHPSFSKTCNWLRISQADAYGALQKLHAVLSIPSPHEAGEENIRTLHKSFSDFLETPSRSGLFSIFPSQEKEKNLQRCSQVLKDVHNMEERTIQISRISLSWPPENNDLIYRWSILAQALEILLIPGVKPSPIIPYDCIPALEDINLASLFSFPLGSGGEQYRGLPLWDMLSGINYHFILGNQKEHKVARIVPISALDVQNAHIYVESVFHLRKDPHWGSGDNFDDEDLGHGPLPQIVRVLERYRVHKPGVSFWPPWSTYRRRNEAAKRIATSATKKPSCQVVLYGRGPNTTILLPLSFNQPSLVFASYRLHQNTEIRNEGCGSALAERNHHHEDTLRDMKIKLTNLKFFTIEQVMARGTTVAMIDEQLGLLRRFGGATEVEVPKASGVEVVINPKSRKGFQWRSNNIINAYSEAH